MLASKNGYQGNMAEQLKLMYNPAFFEALCPVMEKTIPGFDCRAFVHDVFSRDWPDLELKARVRHIAGVLQRYLSGSFSESAPVVIALSEQLKERRMGGFAMMFLADYIEQFGVDDPETALDTMEEVTTLVSCEFAIRPFLARYPDETLSRMYRWSKHPNEKVRRLASEGCRPRLPWAAAIPWLKKEPRKILRVLEALKEDNSEFVRRSVANNLNDIAKDHPQLVLKTARAWKSKHPHTDWILKRGCRTLLKKGDENALMLHGCDPSFKSTLTGLKLPAAGVHIGKDLNFEFTFSSLEKRVRKFRLEYTIDYLTPGGRTSRKVFHITEGLFAPGQATIIRRKRSFRDFTTRKHVAGLHVLAIIVNGKKLAEKSFRVHDSA